MEASGAAERTDEASALCRKVREATRGNRSSDPPWSPSVYRFLSTTALITTSQLHAASTGVSSSLTYGNWTGRGCTGPSSKWKAAASGTLARSSPRVSAPVNHSMRFRIPSQPQALVVFLIDRALSRVVAFMTNGAGRPDSLTAPAFGRGPLLSRRRLQRLVRQPHEVLGPEDARHGDVFVDCVPMNSDAASD